MTRAGLQRFMRDDNEARRPRAAVTAAFAGHAVVVGTLGPWMPVLKDRASLDAGGLGLALTGLSAGLLIGTRVAGPILRRLGDRTVVRVAVPAMAVMLGSLPAQRGLGSLAAAFGLLGVASGVLDIGMNDAAVEVERLARRRVMSAIHGTWSVAMLASAGLASLALSAGLEIGAYFVGAAVALAAATLPLLRWLPSGNVTSTDIDQDALEGDPRVERSIVVPLCLIGAASFIVEGTANEWSAVYLRDHVRASAGVAAFGVVAFSAGMVVSRFIGDRLATRFGAVTVVRMGAVFGAVALGAALVLGGQAVTIVALAAIGIGIGPVVPLTISAAGSIVTRPGRTALAVVVTSAYVGSVVGPAVLGFTADRTGLGVAFFLPVVASILIATVASAVGVVERQRHAVAQA